jgi:hypothetical protein
MLKKMDRTIFINRIIEPILFANQLIEFVLNKHDLVEITLYGKILSVDKKAMKGTYKTAFIRKLIFKNYNFKFDLTKYRNMQHVIEKYFCQDWGLIFKENQKGLFSFKMNVFYIDCIDQDMNSLKELFSSFIKK